MPEHLAHDDSRLLAITEVKVSWMAGDFERALSYTDPDIVWEAAEDAPDAGTYVGHEGVRAHMRDWYDHFELQSFEIHLALGLDDGRVLIENSGNAQGRGSGVNAELRYAQVYTLHAGKLIAVKEYMTLEQAKAAVGL